MYGCVIYLPTFSDLFFLLFASVSIHNLQRTTRFFQAGCKDKGERFAAKTFLQIITAKSAKKAFSKGFSR